MELTHLPRAAAIGLAILAAACAPVGKKPAATTTRPVIETKATSAEAAPEDPYLWLEDIHGDKPLAWVHEQNARTTMAHAGTPEFETTRKEILEVLDSEAKIPFVTKLGDRYYNFWKDQTHPLGLWRRTTLAEYRRANPKWETVLDLDALSKVEGKRWVWDGAECLKPAYRRCLISLSPGGGDASVMREFDLIDKAFVADGFQLPAAKNQFFWIDSDRIYIGSDFGPGSMTKSSYARLVKEWRRGTPLASATTVYEAKGDDLTAFATRDFTPGFERDFIWRAIDFFHAEIFLRKSDGTLAKIDIPIDAENFSTHREWMLVKLRSPWAVGGSTYPAGALVAAKFDDFIAGKRAMTLVYAPTPTTSLASYAWTRHHLILDVLDDVSSRIEVVTPQAGAWKREKLGGAPALSAIDAGGVDEDASDAYFMTVSGFLEPTTLYYGTIGRGRPQALKHMPAFFDAEKFDVHQYFATSKDGTRVPYFVVAPKNIEMNGRNPTLLYGYGGFEVSLRPSYSGSIGRAWLSRGGVYVVANIRGGGEYGPRWHEAALKANRPRAYEDFAAVAKDLVARGITSREHLGTEGGSNGGLLMGNMLTEYPDLFGAIACEVPLLDMKRYTHLSAGASWIAEYGDPDKPEEWAFIKTFSPYQNVAPGKDYPPVLFYTATSDDRVGPVQARKMAAKMEAMGYANAWFYENTEGGHGAAADNKQSAYMHALAYTFLWNHVAGGAK